DATVLETLDAELPDASLGRAEGMLATTMFSPHNTLHVYVDVTDDYLRWVLVAAFEARVRLANTSDDRLLNAIAVVYKLTNALQTRTRSNFLRQTHEHALYIRVNAHPDLGDTIEQPPECFLASFYRRYTRFVCDVVRSRILSLIRGEATQTCGRTEYS